jgi:hypothetical protein
MHNGFRASLTLKFSESGALIVAVCLPRQPKVANIFKCTARARLPQKAKKRAACIFRFGSAKA